MHEVNNVKQDYLPLVLAEKLSNGFGLGWPWIVPVNDTYVSEYLLRAPPYPINMYTAPPAR